MAETDIRLVYITVPDPEIASTIAHQLVERHLIACANILPAMRSIYRWAGKVEQADECVLLCKTVAGNLDRLTAVVVELHPYDLPALVALPVTEGLPSFLDWIGRESQPQA